MPSIVYSNSTMASTISSKTISLPKKTFREQQENYNSMLFEHKIEDLFYTILIIKKSLY